MKNILKWFLGFLVVMVLVAGLKMAKFALFRPPDLDGDRMGDFRGGPDGPPWENGPGAFRSSGPETEEHPRFDGPLHGNMELSFVLADLIDLMVYGLILLPLFYAAYLFGKRSPGASRSHREGHVMSSFKPRMETLVERESVSASQSDYSELDNHMLDQLL